MNGAARTLATAAVGAWAACGGCAGELDDRPTSSATTTAGSSGSDASGTGAVLRDDGRTVLFLADSASTAWAFARLAEVSRSPRFADLASRVASHMLEEFGGAPGGALYASTQDADAAGVFADRVVALAPCALAARALAATSRASGEPSFAASGRSVLAGAATPRALGEQGRMVGGFILAAIELEVVTLQGAREPDQRSSTRATNASRSPAD